ncbi:RES family NAD+ phosphorylase [soil metagenome]
MTVYRFSHPKYADDISGNGARLKGGRWNHPGVAVLYTSSSISLGMLEVLANANTLEQLQMIQLIEIEIPDNPVIHEITSTKLKKGWWNDFEYTQWMGTEIMRSNTTLIIKCPSAVVEQENNFLINPNHELFKKIKLKTRTNFRFDERLFKV